jgi:hypothetical protein
VREAANSGIKALAKAPCRAAAAVRQLNVSFFGGFNKTQSRRQNLDSRRRPNHPSGWLASRRPHRVAGRGSSPRSDPGWPLDRGTTATCRECPELIELGDNPDDALRRMREAIERRAK